MVPDKLFKYSLHSMQVRLTCLYKCTSYCCDAAVLPYYGRLVADWSVENMTVLTYLTQCMRDVDVDVIVSPKKKMQQTFYFNKSEMVKIDREICILYKNIIMKKKFKSKIHFSLKYSSFVQLKIETFLF